MLKLFRFLKPYWWQVILLIASIAVQVWTTLRLPALMADIINNGIVPGNTDYIWETGLRMIGLAFLSAVNSFISSYFSARIGANFSRDIRTARFTKVINFSLADQKDFLFRFLCSFPVRRHAEKL